MACFVSPDSLPNTPVPAKAAVAANPSIYDAFTARTTELYVAADAYMCFPILTALSKRFCDLLLPNGAIFQSMHSLTFNQMPWIWRLIDHIETLSDIFDGRHPPQLYDVIGIALSCALRQGNLCGILAGHSLHFPPLSGCVKKMDQGVDELLRLLVQDARLTDYLVNRVPPGLDRAMSIEDGTTSWR